MRSIMEPRHLAVTLYDQFYQLQSVHVHAFDHPGVPTASAAVLMSSLVQQVCHEDSGEERDVGAQQGGQGPHRGRHS